MIIHHQIGGKPCDEEVELSRSGYSLENGFKPFTADEHPSTEDKFNAI
jgi:hypothetical protein